MKKTIVGYKVVVNRRELDLELAVNALISEGWQPLGPAESTCDSTGLVFHQTMVKTIGEG